MTLGHFIKVLCLFAALYGAIFADVRFDGWAVAVFILIDLHQGGWKAAPAVEPPPGTPAVRISHSVGHRPRKP